VFNLSGEKLAVVLLVALVVLGPDKLPEFVRTVGRLYGELRRMTAGFQSELRDALDEPMQSLRDTATAATSDSAVTETDLGASDTRVGVPSPRPHTTVVAIDMDDGSDDDPGARASSADVSVGPESESPLTGAAG
jgi:sec-independent protein translocase protein TatB